ncbi:MAG TPA: DUF3224 domain-containing protein [Candidatus Angelobacter sp.]|jgi:hypothetical protein|nr:DUF3224 domain-containing protein [Candidatus Angelobacter sp.]
MKKHFRGLHLASRAFVSAIFCGCIAWAVALPSGQTTSAKEPAIEHAKGSFDVKLAPQGEPEKTDGATVSRMSGEKQFHGDLEGTSKVEMLSAMSNVKGSAGYVAIERVTGTLKGRSGSFVLQHNATMTRGKPELNIIVVPDSGTGQLTGLSGKMTIIIAPDGKHSYEFDYTIAPAP